MTVTTTMTHAQTCVFSGAVRQVRSAVSLSREASDRPPVESVPGEEALALQEADSGAMRLRAGEPFSAEMSALWLGVHNLAFTLVCEAHENLLLAEGTLRNLSRHCLEQLHMLGQSSEVSRAGPDQARTAGPGSRTLIERAFNVSTSAYVH